MDSTGHDIRFAELKDTIAELNKKIESLTKAFEESQARMAEKDRTIESLKTNEAEKDTEISRLKEEVEFWKKKLFGKKSEKSNDFPGQISLFNEAEEEFKPSAPEKVEFPEESEASCSLNVKTVSKDIYGGQRKTLFTVTKRRN